MAETKRRNHYVPRFLLNRFASRRKGKTYFVWQYSTDRAAAEISTRDAAVGSFFYGEPTNGLEGRLQTTEDIQAKVLAKIDRGETPEVHTAALRHLIWTLSVRTRALRQHFASAGTSLLDHLEKSAGCDDATLALKTAANREFNRLLLEQARKLPQAYRERALCLLENPARREAFRAVIMPQIESMDIQGFIGWLRQEAGARLDLHKSAADGQIRAMSQLLDRADAPEGFSPTHWQLITRPAGTFVLGDGCVFATDGKGRIATLFAIGRGWKSVYLPISDSVVLVGASHPIESVLPDDDINVASAALGADVFFASRCTQREKDYVAKLGSGVPLMADTDMAELARQSWRDLKEGKEPPSRAE